MTESTAAVPSEAPAQAAATSPAPPPVPSPPVPSPPVAPPPKPSMLLALFAGLVPLMALPLSVVAFVVMASGGDDLRDAWLEGGVGMYAVTASLVASVVFSGIALGVAGRAWAPAAFAVPFLALLPALVGRAFTGHALGLSVEAVEHAAPIDRSTILMGSLAEALWTTTFGGLATGTLALVLALAFTLAALARRRDARTGSRNALAASAPVAFLLGVTAFASAGLAHAWAGPFRAVAHASPVDTVILLATSIEDLAPWERARAIFVVLTIAAGLGGAAVARRSVPAAVTVALGSLLTVGALFGTTRLATPSAFNAAISQSTEHSPLLTVNAPPLRDALGPLVTDQPPVDWAQNVRQRRELHRWAGEDAPVPVGLAPTATAAALETTLQVAAENGATTVELLVDAPADPKGLPTLPAPFDVLSKGTRGVTIGLGSTAKLCGEACEGVTLEKDALVVKGERWPLEEKPTALEPYGAEAVVVPLGAFEPKQVLLAAMAAASHQKRLTFAIEGLTEPDPAPHGEGESPDDQREETPPPPAGVVAISKLTVQGGVSPKAVRSELDARLEALAQCTVRSEEPLKLPLTRKLQLAVLSTGEVSGVVAVSDVPDAQVGVEDCLEWHVKDLSLEPHTPKGVSVVTLELSVTEPKASPPAKKK